MLELAKLIDLIVGFASPVVQNKLQRSELVIKLLKQLNLDPDHPPADFTAVYQYTLVEYGIGKPKPMLELFRQSEIQAIFRQALDQNNPSLLLKEGETFLSGHSLGDRIRELGIDARQEFYQFAAVFIEVAKRTRTPAEVLANQRLESLHRQIGSIQERLHRLPTLEAMRTEIARLNGSRGAEEQGSRGDSSLPLAPSAPPPLRPSATFALAQQMKGWFETLGYRFESYEVWQDDYFEWMIDIPVRRGRYDRILVRGIDGEVGLSDIRALRQSVETQRSDEGWLVTARRISRAAREEVEKEENHDLGCYTFDELLDQDADFGGYLDWLESEIGRRGIEQRYVPLACTKEEIDPDTKQRMGVSRYDDRDGWIDGYIDLWLDDPAKEHISVLGEFGTGKTWFAFHYASQALKRYREAQQRGVERPRLPLVIPLRDYAKAVSVESLFSEFFFRKHEVRSLTYSAFEQLNRMGKLLLIFDGFDEMAARVDRQEMINNFWELAKAVVPGAKVILTCRTEHFPEAREGRDVLNAQLQASTTNLTGEMPQFEVLELEKFNDEQIRQVMLLQAESATVEQVMGNLQLLDLARRPVMTELILEALPDIEAGKPVDMSRVYLYAVRRKMERDIKEERTFTSLAEKLYFLCELSWEMLSSDRMSLNYREFPDRIRRLFGSVVQEEKDLDHWHYDMMGQTMLIRNADGDYMPAHRSLLEFFVAYKFAAELGALAPDFLELAQMQTQVDTSLEPREYRWSEYFGQKAEGAKVAPLQGFVSEELEVLRSGFGKIALSKAVQSLIAPMLNSFCITKIHPIETVINNSRGKAEEEINFTVGNALTLIARLSRQSPQKLNLENLIIKGVDLTEMNVQSVSFAKSSLIQNKFLREIGNIDSVALDSTNKALALSSECSVYLLNFDAGLSQLEILPYESPIHIRALRFNSRGLLAGGNGNGEIHLWDAKSRKLLQLLQGHTLDINNIIFSKDGMTLLSSSRDKTVRVWDVLTGKCQFVLQHSDYELIREAFLNESKNIIMSRCFNIQEPIQEPLVDIIHFWDLIKGQSIKSLDSKFLHTTPHPYDDIFAGIKQEGRVISIVNFLTDEVVTNLEGHQDVITGLRFTENGKKLASCSHDGEIKVWSMDNFQCLHTLQAHNSSIRSMSFSQNSELIVSCDFHSKIKIWNLNGENLYSLDGYCVAIQKIIWNLHADRIVGITSDNKVQIWNPQTTNLERLICCENMNLTSIASDSASDQFAISSSDGKIDIYSIISGNVISSLKCPEKGIKCLAYSHNGDEIAIGTEDGTIWLWQARTASWMSKKQHNDAVDVISFNSNGNLLASGSLDGTAIIWNLEDFFALYVLNEHVGHVHAIAFSPDGNLLATGGDDQAVILWDLQAGQSVRKLKGHDRNIYSLEFDLSGEMVVSGSLSGEVFVWNASTGEKTRTLQPSKKAPLDAVPIAISPDGTEIATGELGTMLTIWNIKTGACDRQIRNRPYEGMNITEVKGLTEAEKVTLRALGAVED